MGDSGGGKSSLINLLVRFYDSSAGKITFDNIDIKRFIFENFKRKYNIVTQRVIYFNDTIAAMYLMVKNLMI